MRLGVLLVAFAVLLGLSGCGQKGPLEPPPSAATPQAEGQPAPPPPPKAPNEPFILDPLL